MERVVSWMNKKYNLNNKSEGELFDNTGLDVKYNKVRHQYKNSECGVYSMNFIIRLLRGEGFKEISKSKVIDDQMNQCREVYFSQKRNK